MATDNKKPAMTAMAAAVHTAHATLSPSGYDGWSRCAPKLAMEQGRPDQSSGFADEGTAAHFLASESLEAGVNAFTYKGQIITVWSDALSRRRGTNWHGKDQIPATAKVSHFAVDHDMAAFVQVYIDAIHARMEQFRLRGAVSVELLIEIKVEFSTFVGFEDQFGTSDVVLLIEWQDGTMQIDVNDLKFGRGVKVNAADFELMEDGTCATVLQDCRAGNGQMMIYALGAYDQFQALGNYTRASWCIHQPRLGHISEAECAIEALLLWAAQTLKPAAERAIMYMESRGTPFVLSDFTPGEKQCMWCRAKPCAAQTQYVFETVSADFVDLDADGGVQPQIADSINRIGALTNSQVGEALTLVDFIEDWCKAVRARTESEMLAGREVPGWKLVQGKQGNRTWFDKEEAEKTLRSFRLKQEQMFNYSLISPTDAEKLAPHKLKKGGTEVAKTPLRTKQWEKLQAFITRANGKPSVAPESDSRPALVLSAPEEAFSNLDDGEDMA